MKKSILLLTTIISFISLTSYAQTQKEFTPKQATKWFDKWSKTHKVINVDNIVDIQELAKQYHAHQAWWDEAFAYLEKTDFSKIEPSRYQIDTINVSAVVSVGPPHEYSDLRWESHQTIADIHYLISGGERVGVAPLSTATVTKPFNGTVDSAGYTAKGKTYSYTPGGYFIIFPNQVHQPGVTEPGYDNYKKIVVKVRVI